MRNEDIFVARVDLPRPIGTVAYWYVPADAETKWHPWWGEMFRFLIALPRTDLGRHPDGGEMAIAKMTGRALERFFNLVDASPVEERKDNPTLRIALKTRELGPQEVAVRLFTEGNKANAPAP